MEGNNTVIKRFMQVGVVAILVCVYLLFIQFHGDDLRSKQVEKDNKNVEQPTIYSLNKVVDVFEKQNITLKRADKIDPKPFQLEYVTPHIYNVNNNNKRNLFIYVFNNVTKRKKVLESNGPYSMYFSSNNYFTVGMYQTWNVLIVDTLKAPLNRVNNNVKDLNIEQIVFKELNHGNVQTFEGETDHWKGTFTLKYYTHFWKDENGIEQVDNYGSGEFFIHYKLPIRNEVVKYNYELKAGTVSESTQDADLNLNKDGNLLIGIDDMGVLAKDDVPIVTLTWNKGRETIQFKAKK